MHITAYLETGKDTVYYKYMYLHRCVVPGSELEGEVHERPTIEQQKKRAGFGFSLNYNPTLKMQLYKKAAIYIQIVSNIKHCYCTVQVKLCVRPFSHQETHIWQLMNKYRSF